MATKVYLHIGLPKSGTTYLQAVLAANKMRLADHFGILYPGESWIAQVSATRDVLSAARKGSQYPDTEGAWERLVGEIAAWPGDAIISMEWLASARPAQVRRITRSLAPATVEVVVTVRDLGRTIPAAWQEFVQNYKPWSWSEFLGSITSENPRATPAGNLFWAQQNLATILAVWGDVLPPERLTVVTLPHPGAPASELWTRFASVLGVEASRFDASGRGSNESLGLESAVLMHRLNTVSRLNGVEWSLYNKMFKHALAKRGLAKRKHRESVLAIPTEYHEWVRACASEQIRAVHASHAHVVGNLADLEPVFADGGIQPQQVSPEAVLEAALDGLVALAQDRGSRQNRPPQRSVDPRKRKGPLGRQLSTTRARAALLRISNKRPWAITARRAYRLGRRGLSGRPR